MALLGRDGLGDDTKGSSRWTVTSRSPEGITQDERKPQTSGNGSPKSSNREVLMAALKVLAAMYLAYKIMGD